MNYLYFATAAADGTTATEEVIMVSANQVSHYEMQTATDLRIYLKETVGQEVLGSDGDNFAEIVLTITSGKHKEVMKALAKAANNPLSFDGGFVVIADSENSDFISSDITACASITIVDA